MNTKSTTFKPVLSGLILFLLAAISMAAPIADFSVSGYFPCANQAVVFTNTSSGNISGYSWNFGAGASPSTSVSSTSVNVIFSSAGNYNVSLTVSGPDGTNSVTKLITVSSAPPVLSGTISGSTSVCLNAGNLVYSVSPNSSAATYNWTLPAGASITSGQGTSSIVAALGTNSGNVCVTAGNGCGTGNQICQAVDIAKEQIIFMNYNLLNYPAQSAISTDTSARNPHFRTILQYADPDIMVAQEVTGQNGVDIFLNNVLNANGNKYSAGIFINGFDTDNAIFYRTSKFTFVSNTPIITDLRDISEFKLVHNLSGDTIRIFSVHLKASNSPADESQRALEADTLRKYTNALAQGSNFIVCGDFNFYRSGESGYQKLLAVTPGVDGHFIDPITMSGTWNNISYAPYHTQSPRVRSFGGGSTGGLNDRFDLVLFSNAMMQSGGVSYVHGSTYPMGNDGNHYNDSINQQPNTAVPSNVADALHYAADHLPLMCELEFQNSSCPIADLGVSGLASPSVNICSASSQSVQVYVRNFGTSSINFAFNNLQITGQVTLPSSVVQNLSGSVNSGTLNPGSVMTVTLNGTVNMNTAGNYFFSATTVFSGDTLNGNDAMIPAAVTVYPNTAASISSNGPVNFCQGGNVLLTCNQSSGVTYQWKRNGTNIINANSVSYNANQSGSYQVQLQSSSSVTTTYPVTTFTNPNSYTIPNNSCTGASSSIAVAGYISNVQSSGISVKVNINHSAVGDLVIFLQSNSGEIIGLSNRTGNSSNTGDNFTNTIFSDAGSMQLPASGAPYSSTYKPWTSVFSSCITSNKTTFASLNNGSLNPNGNWRLWVYDRASGNSNGSIVNWSITFPSYSVNSILTCDPVMSAPVNVTVNPDPVLSFSPAMPVICSNTGTMITVSGASSYVWSPVSGLNTSAGSSVFANPVSATVYTVTGTSATGCVSSSTVNVNLFTQPVVTFDSLDAVCVTTSPFALSGGSPSGGTYSGAGVTGGIFNPSNAGVGTHVITYSYTDGNGCSAVITRTITVTGFPAATVSPSGPVTLCQSSGIQLSTISGYNYLWSNGATTQSITTNTAGNYSVVVSDNSGCSATSSVVVVSNSSLQFENPVFTESLGSVGGTVSIAAHETANGFDNDALTMSGTGDLRITNASSGYTGASGSTNVFLTNTIGKNFIVSGINTTGITGLQLSFGILKSTTVSNGSDLLVQYSTDGVNYISMPYSLPTGNGTAVWTLRTVSGLPATSALSLQFIQTGTTTQYRIDDIRLFSQNPNPSITITGNTNLCQGNSVTLTAAQGNNYLWSNGETTNPISVNSAGEFSCAITSGNGCTAVTNEIILTANPEIFNLTGGGGFCTGETGAEILLSGSQLNVTYQLQKNSTDIGVAQNGTGEAISFGQQNQSGVYTVVATYTPTACTAGMNGSIQVTENNLPDEYILTGNSSFCSGSAGSVLGLSGSQNGINYQLKRNGNSAGPVISGTGNPLSFGAQNIPGIYSVTATNFSTLCTTDFSSSISLQENSSPLIYSLTGGGGICPDSIGVNIEIQNSQPGVNYLLYNFSGSTGINFNGNGTAISFGTFNSPENYFVIATDIVSSCQSVMTDTISVFHLPLPTLFNMTGGGTFCSLPGTGVPVGLNNSESDVEYSLYKDLVFVNSQSGTGSILSFGNVTQAGTYTVVAEKITSGCVLPMNGSVDVIQQTATYWYQDADNDGYGNPAVFIQNCTQPSGYISDNTDCNDAGENANPDAVEICGNNIDDNCNGMTDEDCNINLSIKVFIQGFYSGNSEMNSPLYSSVVSDTLVIKLASATAPFNIIYSDTTFVETDGNVLADFPAASMNLPFYIVIDHRNSLETWSSVPVLIDQNFVSYDLTESASGAFGNNLVNNGDGTFSIYSGDLNKDGVIDFQDLSLMESALTGFKYLYDQYDITGDNLIETSDYSLIENNILNSISIQRP